jgi:hypothetical protein
MTRLRSLLHPFELLYLAIAIATFQHTAWTAAYLFEGPQPEGSTMWIIQGALIAIAVDIGMLLTSRFLVGAHGRQKLVLIVAFIIAAVTSFFFQLVYMAIHTPTVVVSVGVSEKWAGFLQSVIDSRVLLLPLALPVLATVYTLARLTHVKANVPEAVPQMSDDDPQLTVTVTRIDKNLLQLGDGRFLIEGLTFTDTLTGVKRGPYKSSPSMKRAIKSLMNDKERQ